MAITFFDAIEGRSGERAGNCAFIHAQKNHPGWSTT